MEKCCNCGGCSETLFTGYDHLDDEGEVLAIDVDGQLTDSATSIRMRRYTLIRHRFMQKEADRLLIMVFMSTEDCHAKVISVEKSHGVYAHRVLIEKRDSKERG